MPQVFPVELERIESAAEIKSCVYLEQRMVIAFFIWVDYCRKCRMLVFERNFKKFLPY